MTTEVVNPTQAANPEQPINPDSAEKSSAPTSTLASPTTTEADENLPTEEDREAAHRAALKRAKFFGDESQRAGIVRLEAKTVAAEAYLKRLNAGKDIIQTPQNRLAAILNRIENRKRNIRGQEIGLSEAQIIIRRIYDVELATQEREFYLQPGVAEIFDDVLRYFIGDPYGPLPLSKGLYFYGATGVGKSYLLKMLKKFCDFVPIPSMQFQIVKTKEILQAVADSSSLKPINPYKTGNMLLDDLGEERSLKKIYGDAENPMDLLLSARSDEFVDAGVLTHFTSNLLPEDLTKRYGSRIEDRIHEMATIINIPGTSYRKDDVPTP